MDAAPARQRRDLSARVLRGASGWGALAVRTGDLAADPATPFPTDTLGAPQQPWLDRLDGRSLPTTAPALRSSALRALLAEPATAGDWLHRGLQEAAEGDRAAAVTSLTTSVELEPSAPAHLALAALAEPAEAVHHLQQAHRLRPDSTQIVVLLLQRLLDAGDLTGVLDLVDGLPAEQRSVGRVQLAEAWAAAGTGQAARARRLLADGIEIADLREGERSFDALWTTLAAVDGDRSPLPPHYDFRMQ